MSRPLCSVVLASYNRGHLLSRSLACYECQDFDRRGFELIVIDDSSTDQTAELVRCWSQETGIAAVVLSPYPKYGGWRDCGEVLNFGIRAARGRHVILTHPEVMPGRRSVAACVTALENGECSRLVRSADWVGLYACCRVYYLSPRDQERIDSVPWRDEGNLAVRRIDGFYDEDASANPEYTHAATDRVAQPGSSVPVWESFVFGGHSRETWKRLGGMLPTSQWGSVDVGWVARRRTLGVPNHTSPDDDTIVVHQNHDLPGDLKTPRVMERWVEELKRFPLADRTRMVWPAVDELGW